MTDLAITLAPETAADGEAIDRLHARTFGPGRFARTAFRIREGAAHRADVSFTARVGTLLIGSVRVTPVTIGGRPGLFLGPVTVEPPFRGRGVGRQLIERALAAARKAGDQLVFLVGDVPYYGRLGFAPVPKGQVTLPGPVDPERLLVCELAQGAFSGVSGRMQPDPVLTA
jgi:predicted N-acetyltransferase YhbS